MKSFRLISIVTAVMFVLFGCGQLTNPNNQSDANGSQPMDTSFLVDNSLNQYITYNLPDTLINGSQNRELGYLGGNLFYLKDTGSYVAEKASTSTPYGWGSYGGVEMYYKLNCKFDKGQLTDVSLPWNHSMYLSKAQPVDRCEVSAVIVQVSHDLYTAPEIDAKDISNDKLSSTMWYVFFAKENSDISYAIFLNADHFSKEDTISLAQSVIFKDNAFNFRN